MPLRAQQELKPKFPHPDIISYDHNSFIINGKETYIFSGCFHYFRSVPNEWINILQKIRDAGFNTIETYVPWNLHEPIKGKTDFNLLNKFLDDCKQMNLYVIIRVGPYVCGEWDEGGFPHWLAGKNIGFRTASSQNIYWSKYWYDEVLPVVRKHLITNGGNIILLQIENEYDYYGVPDSQKVVYLKSLYHNVIQNGIDVPVITCWTKQSRNNTDSVFSQIMDAVNGYPRWNIDAVLPRIEQVKKQEPDAPPFFTELQGGWFTGIGDKTVRHISEMSGAQINALTKYVIAHGIKGFSYYMLYGGTNFGYTAGKWKTTSYDYTAPISECGGLWEKYYSVKLIGDFLKYSDPYLSRSREIVDGAVSDNPAFETVLRSDESTGFVFIRNKTKKLQNANVEVKIPEHSSYNISVSIDSLGAYFLPIDLPITGGNILHYSNVELSAVTEYNGKPLLIAYGRPGEQAVIDYGSKIFKGKILTEDQLYNWDGIYILLTSRNRASRSIVFDTKKGPLVLLSDSYLASPIKNNGDSNNVIDLQTRPGEDKLSFLLTGGTEHINLNGKPVAFSKISDHKMVQFKIKTPAFSTPKIGFGKIHYRKDRTAEGDTNFKTMPLPNNGIYPSLDSLGEYQNGYYIYQGNVDLADKHMLKVGYYEDDWHSVFIDGKPVKGLTGNNFQDWADVNLSKGMHEIKIIYENEGRPNTGFLEEKKGIKYIHILEPGHLQTLTKWKYYIQKSVEPEANPVEATLNYNDSGWMNVSVGNGLNERVNKEQVGTWYRKTIDLSSEEANSNPKLIFGGISRSTIVYINGKYVYNYRHHGLDMPFDVSLNGLVKAGRNFLAIYVENREGKGGIVKPIVFEHGTEKPLKLLQFDYHNSLNGKIAGWQKPEYQDNDWKTIQTWDDSKTSDGITWYRTSFTIPSYKDWIVPWRLHIESTGDLQIWLNGKLVGRYFAVGPQEDFYLPDGWLKTAQRNSLVLVMRSSGNGEIAPKLKKVEASPYTGYVVRKNMLEVDQ